MRPAEGSDREAALAALVDAFMDDPVATWTTPADRHRPSVLRRFFGTIYDARAGEGLISVEAEGRGAALWALPGRWRTTPAQDLRIARAFAHPRHWRRAPLVGRGMLGLERAHPPSPRHFYLAVLGVAPSLQGQGVGSRLLAPVLEICDSDGVPAFLESSKESNVAFYARHGFRVTHEHRLPRGPTMYAMWREPHR